MVNQHILASPKPGSGFPGSLYANYYARPYREDWHFLSGPIVEAVLIVVLNEDVVSRMTSVAISVEKVIPLWNVPVAFASSYRLKSIACKGEDPFYRGHCVGFMSDGT
ncbi:hypothetical protein WDZ92_00510 [Nostoc sp. NIES-2111]